MRLTRDMTHWYYVPTPIRCGLPAYKEQAFRLALSGITDALLLRSCSAEIACDED